MGALYHKLNTQSNAHEDGQNNCLKHVELTGNINKPLLLHLVGCLYYLYHSCTVKQISDNKIYLLIKYMKSVLWRVAKRLSYIEDAWCLKVNLSRVVVERSALGAVRHNSEGAVRISRALSGRCREYKSHLTLRHFRHLP